MITCKGFGCQGSFWFKILLVFFFFFFFLKEIEPGARKKSKT
jgi:hypothetical protein